MIGGLETKTRQPSHQYNNTVINLGSNKNGLGNAANNARTAKKTDALLVNSGSMHRGASSMMLSSETTKLTSKPTAAAAYSEHKRHHPSK